MRLHATAEWIESVLEIVTCAAQAVWALDQGRQSGGQVREQRKSDGSPLSDADQLAHRILSEGLGRLHPVVPVVSEESAQSWAHRLPRGSFWLIDPLDGTKEFLSRRTDYTVNAAFIQDGEPAFGVVSVPAEQACYWGGLGLGAWFRGPDGATHGLPTAVHRPPGSTWETPRATLRVTMSRSHLDPTTERYLESLSQRHVIERIAAGSSLKFCLLATGQADLYPRLAPTHEWDTAAAQAVLEGAGGVVLDARGHRLLYGKPEGLNASFLASGSRRLAESVGLEPFIVLAQRSLR